MSIFQKICLLVTIIGALNWGLIGAFEFDLVSYLFGQMTVATRIIYGIVSITGIINIALLTLRNPHRIDKDM